MRNAQNRKEVDRLYVLGAGASLAATEVRSRSMPVATYQAPLDAEFAARIANLDLERPAWVSEARDRVVGAFRPSGRFEHYGLEEAILRQLGLLELLQALHPRRSREQIDASEWMDLLTHLICVVLRRTRHNSSSLYRRLGEVCFPAGSSIDDLHNRVVTFNYDTLFDTYLLEHWSPTDVYFDEIRERRDRPARADQGSPLLLKLHGSINWRCASADLRALIQGGGSGEDLYEIEAVWVDGSSSPSPKDKTSPLIIPPLPTKPITSVKLFQWLWTRAYEYLHSARELVVVGYSLPKADQVAESMFGSFRPSRLERVVVIDPSTAALDRWRTVLKRAGLAGLSWVYYECLADYLRTVEGPAGFVEPAR